VNEEELEMTWGAHKKRGAICITFDNFGEAAELEYQLWPKDKVIGEHYTATEVLPEILGALDEAHLKASFFVEGWNGDVYPQALKAMRDAGHDVGFHGWRHEVWSEQSSEARQEIIEKSVKALSANDKRPLGFRPPGGDVTEDTAEQLLDAGFKYFSPVGEGAKRENDIASLPFRWTEVDALYFEPFMAGAREKMFGNRDARSIEQWLCALQYVIDKALATGGCYTVIFHAYLLGQDEGRLKVFKDFLKALNNEPELWVAPCIEVANWMQEIPKTEQHSALETVPGL